MAILILSNINNCWNNAILLFIIWKKSNFWDVTGITLMLFQVIMLSIVTHSSCQKLQTSGT